MGSHRDDVGAVYEIRVQGELDRDWEMCLDGLTISLTHTGSRSPVTTLVGPLADQAALRGVLCRLWDMNLTLISVRRIGAETGGEER